jgi:hypothetical protein
MAGVLWLLLLRVQMAMLVKQELVQGNQALV